MGNKKNTEYKIILDISNSSIYKNDDQEFIDYLRKEKNKTWDEAESLIKSGEYKNILTEDDFNTIEENLNNYYYGDYWNMPSYIRDNKMGIKWTIQIDRDNKEIIFSGGIGIHDDNDGEDFYSEDLEKLGLINEYEEIFNMYFNSVSETDNVKEVEYIEANDIRNNTISEKIDKADYVLIIMEGNHYGYYEYNIKK